MTVSRMTSALVASTPSASTPSACQSFLYLFFQKKFFLKEKIQKVNLSLASAGEAGTRLYMYVLLHHTTVIVCFVYNKLLPWIKAIKSKSIKIGFCCCFVASAHTALTVARL